MPVHERYQKDGDLHDLANDAPKRGIAGNSGGSVRPGDPIQDLPIGASPDIARPAAPAAAATATAGQLNVTYTAPAGASKSEVIVFRNDRNEVVKKQTGASPVLVTGLASGVAHTAYVRGVGADGRIGQISPGGVGTPA